MFRTAIVVDAVLVHVARVVSFRDQRVDLQITELRLQNLRHFVPLFNIGAVIDPVLVTSVVPTSLCDRVGTFRFRGSSFAMPIASCPDIVQRCR